MSVGQEHIMDAVQQLHGGIEESIVHPLQHGGYKARERLISTNKYSRAFSSLHFASTQIPLLVPNSQVITGIWVNMNFPLTVNTDVLCPMAGYQAIKQIAYQCMGSTLYTQSGRDVFHINRAMCSTKDQIDELISLGGGPANITGVQTVQTSIWLPLPWSRLNSAWSKARYGVDTSIFETQQLYITNDLEATANIYITGASNNALTFGNFRIQGLDYMDKTQRIMPLPDAFFSFPIHYYQSFQTASYTPASATDTQSVILTSFRKGNLVGLYLWACDDANNNGTNKFKVNEIVNMSLKFNNVSIYEESGIDGRMSALQYNLTPPQFFAYNQVNRVKEVVFSNLPPRFKPFTFNGGLNLSGQSLDMQFQITNSVVPQKIYVIYIYDALLLYNRTQAEIVL